MFSREATVIVAHALETFSQDFLAFHRNPSAEEQLPASAVHDDDENTMRNFIFARGISAEIRARIRTPLAWQRALRPSGFAVR
jgi:hypothetical protein